MAEQYTRAADQQRLAHAAMHMLNTQEQTSTESCPTDTSGGTISAKTEAKSKLVFRAGAQERVPDTHDESLASVEVGGDIAPLSRKDNQERLPHPLAPPDKTRSPPELRGTQELWKWIGLRPWGTAGSAIIQQVRFTQLFSTPEGPRPGVHRPALRLRCQRDNNRHNTEMLQASVLDKVNYFKLKLQICQTISIIPRTQ
jgi:hypothetical protein